MNLAEILDWLQCNGRGSLDIQGNVEVTSLSMFVQAVVLMEVKGNFKDM